MTSSLRVLELFSGIGGCAAALPAGCEVVGAVDQSAHARATYARNFSEHRLHGWNLAGVKAEQIGALAADLWWMSPPCQPFTTRGLRRDLDDPRCRPFSRIVELVVTLSPRFLALENVPAFQGSRAHGLLLERLTGAGYRCREGLLCPTELGVPNRRQRYYLLARRGDQEPLVGLPADTGGWQSLPGVHACTGLRALGGYLDKEPADALYVDSALVGRYRNALHVAEPAALEPLSCFTAAYGRSMVRSGGYLKDSRGIRRFSPDEILRLLGFPSSFGFPVSLPIRKRWALLGNSLSVVAVRAVLQALPVTPASPAA